MHYIDNAVKNTDYIIPYFQDIYNMSNNTIIGKEVLMRIKDVDGKIHTPGEFLGILTEKKLTDLFQTVVIKKAIEALKDDNCKIFINLFVDYFKRPDVITSLVEFIKQNEVQERVVFEVLEDYIDFQDENVNKSFNIIFRAGIHVAIDDFGSRWSFMKRISDVPYSIIKIDRDFLNDRCDYVQDILLSIISISEKYGNMVIFEGIESKEDMEYVKSLGGRIGQGYFFSEPSENP